MIGLDVTHRAVTTPALQERLRATGATGAFVADLVDFFAVYHRETYGWDGAPIHDAVAVAHVIRPGLVETRHRNVEVELESDLCRGRTVVDLWNRTDRPANAHVGVTLDTAGVLRPPRRAHRQARSVKRGANAEQAGEWPDSLDALIAAPEHHSLVFENDEVRILDTRIGTPGETVPLHTHRWPAVLYFLASDHVVQRDADGNVLVDTRITGALVEPGGAVWVGTLPPSHGRERRRVGDPISEPGTEAPAVPGSEQPDRSSENVENAV